MWPYVKAVQAIPVYTCRFDLISSNTLFILKGLVNKLYCQVFQI